MRYRETLKHSLDFLKEHQPKKFEKMVEAGEFNLNKFKNKIKGRYGIVKIFNGSKNRYFKFRYTDEDIELKFFERNIIFSRDERKLIHEIKDEKEVWRFAKLSMDKPPYHLNMIIQKEPYFNDDGFLKTDSSIYQIIDTEELFNKRKTETMLYLFDDEESMELFSEIDKIEV